MVAGMWDILNTSTYKDLIKKLDDTISSKSMTKPLQHVASNNQPLD
jgi:hypothetical protein